MTAENLDIHQHVCLVTLSTLSLGKSIHNNTFIFFTGIGEKHKVKHRVTKLSEQVRLIIDHYKASDPEGLPVVNIPDPVRIPDKNRRLGLGVNLILHDTFVYGLSKCKIKATDMDFGKLEVSLIFK